MKNLYLIGHIKDTAIYCSSINKLIAEKIQTKVAKHNEEFTNSKDIEKLMPNEKEFVERRSIVDIKHCIILNA